MVRRAFEFAALQSRQAVAKTREAWRSGGSLLPAIAKGLLFAVLLLYVQQSGFSVWPLLLLLAASVISYMQPVFKTMVLGTSFAVLVALSLLLTSQFTLSIPAGALPAGTLGQAAFAAVFGFLFFVLLGLKNLLLLHRRRWYAVLFVSLLYGISLLFFAAGAHAASSILLLFVFCYLLLREHIRFHGYEQGRVFMVICATLSLLAVEVAWGLSLLTLGFSNSASVLTLLVLSMITLVERYLRGTLDARFIRLSLLLFVGLCAIIFSSARWLI